jgi:hypothetical protein
MPSVPVSLFYRSNSGYGWSETYHYQPALGVPDPLDVQQLATYRAAMLTTDIKITHARIGTDIKRLVRIVPLNGGAGYPGQISPPTAPPECAILFRLSNPANGFNNIFIRGFDRASVSGDAFTPSSEFNSAGGIWENYLFSSGIWNIVGTLGTPDTSFPVTNITPLKPRGFSCNIIGASLAVGDTLRISGSSVPGYNGRKTVVDIGAGVPPPIKMGGASPAAANPDDDIEAVVEVYFDVVITQVQFQKVTRRGAGRPFGLVRGRQETQYSLRQ